ncbi:MAG: GTP-binding protein HflX [Planctomycetota bacterium]|jgi:GTP-binding protein HflX
MRVEIRLHKTEDKRLERAILVGAGTADVDDDEFKMLDELDELARTAGVKSVARMYQRRQRPDTTYYIGKGKAEELASKIREHEAQCVLFDNDLTPRQVRNLEEKVGCKVLDRSEVILDIFATHAKTMESRLQVELAQLRYTLPRLKRMWTHLDRISGKGGIGGRGPGEKQIESDRRLIDRRLHQLETELKEISIRKERQVGSREEKLTVALVGYTNAGKSTLMHQVTGADVYQADKLFATLDTKTSDLSLPNGQTVFMSDTVGFIENLPHHLIASFHATLEEVRQAKLLLHIVSASEPGIEMKIKTVDDVLHKELGMENYEQILVFNKIDAVEDQVAFNALKNKHKDFIEVSAKTGEGVDTLIQRLVDFDEKSREVIELEIDVADGKTQAQLSRLGEILETQYEGNRVFMTVSLPKTMVGHFKQHLRS